LFKTVFSGSVIRLTRNEIPANHCSLSSGTISLITRAVPFIGINS
jgi:hypothetical protein